MSAHQYFRDFGYCDNGNILWLLICQLVSVSSKSLSQLIKETKDAFPCSGEINMTVQNPDHILASLKTLYEPLAKYCDETDGLGIEFETWRFNVRISNTEPLLSGER